MLTDAAAIGLALFAASLAARPPSGRYTFGLRRAEILVRAGQRRRRCWCSRACSAIEAIRRLFDPPDVEGGLVIVVGAARRVRQRRRRLGALARGAARLNVEGAMAHVLTDLYASSRRSSPAC